MGLPGINRYSTNVIVITIKNVRNACAIRFPKYAVRPISEIGKRR